MAQFSGYVCDVCEKIASKLDSWIQLSGGPNTQGKIDVCSNKCLVKVARQRLEAEKDLYASDPNNGHKERPSQTKHQNLSRTISSKLLQKQWSME